MPTELHAKKESAPTRKVELAHKRMPASMQVSGKTRSSNSSGKVKVQPGDSVYVLAKKYGVSSRELIESNDLKAPYHLIAGRKLTIPTARVHKVGKGETLYAISRDYGVDMRSIVKENNLRKPYVLLQGMKLKIPPRSYTRTQDKPREVARGSTKEKRRSTQEAVEFAPKISHGQFTWPARGKLVSSFGAKQGGVYNDGINISAKEGSKVYSAAAGEVVYAGNELKGYGNLVIIRHNGGWMTAYGHVREFAVEKGDHVKKGQLIAYVGTSGNVDKPQLHFALRKGRKALDPMKYLSS